MIKNHIPNILTLFNLLMGCCALYFIFIQEFNVVFWLVALAAIADVLDGLVARWLKVDGGLGKQLDSLADVVTFGVVPGAILFQLIRYAHEAEYGMNGSRLSIYLAFMGFIFTLGAALRLARFNIDERQTTEFIGLATPGATVSVLGLMLIHNQGEGWWNSFFISEYVLIGLAILLFLLMNSPIRMFSLKSVKSGWKGNELPIVFMALAIPLAIIFKGPALLTLPVVYTLISFFFYSSNSILTR
ncbi:MAG: CDP-alcohol phosphatidyltransferase family protein [Saprospiraceae bacterium]